jgi:ABC-type lipoprotein release transport system permease subunit
MSRDFSVYLFTFAVSVVIASLASMMPARRAAKYVPVRILRGDG